MKPAFLKAMTLYTDTMYSAAMTVTIIIPEDCHHGVFTRGKISMQENRGWRGGKAFARRERISKTYGTHRSTSFIYWPMPKLHCSWYELMVICPLSPLMMQVASMPLSLVSPHVPLISQYTFSKTAIVFVVHCRRRDFWPHMWQHKKPCGTNARMFEQMLPPTFASKYFRELTVHKSH